MGAAAAGAARPSAGLFQRAQLRPGAGAELVVLGDCGCEVVRRGAVLAEGGGQEPEVVVHGPGVGDRRSAHDVGSRQRQEALIELAALGTGAAPRRRLGGDGREPQVIAGGGSRAVGLLHGEACHDGGGALQFPAVGGLQRPPGRPGLNRGFGIGAPAPVAAAFRPEAGQLPALDVVDQDGIRASHVLRGPPGRADQRVGFFELADEERGGGAAGLRVPSRGGVTQLLGFPAEQVQLGVGGGVAELEQGSGAQQPGLGGQVGAVQLAGEGEQLIENGQALAGRPGPPADIMGGDQAMGERPRVAGPAGQG